VRSLPYFAVARRRASASHLAPARCGPMRTLPDRLVTSSRTSAPPPAVPPSTSESGWNPRRSVDFLGRYDLIDPDALQDIAKGLRKLIAPVHHFEDVPRLTVAGGELSVMRTRKPRGACRLVPFKREVDFTSTSETLRARCQHAIPRARARRREKEMTVRRGSSATRRCLTRSSAHPRRAPSVAFRLIHGIRSLRPSGILGAS